MKFHFVLAASRTSFVLILSLLKIIDNSFIKAMLTSLCVFSITFAASATLILGALCVPAIIISEYKSSIILATFKFEPDVIFLIFEIVYFLSPGFIRSGLYPQKKSLLYFNFEIFSNIGTQTSSTQPGYTVDS